MQLAVQRDRRRCSARSRAAARRTAGRVRNGEEGCKTRGFVYKFQCKTKFHATAYRRNTKPTTHTVVWSLCRSVEEASPPRRAAWKVVTLITSSRGCEETNEEQLSSEEWEGKDATQLGARDM